MCNDIGMSLIHISAMNGDHQIMSYLIHKGLHVNSVDNYGNTPLHYAVRGNFIKCIQMLVEKDADENIKNNDGMVSWDMKT
jgi:ankyrin repeat protein